MTRTAARHAVTALVLLAVAALLGLMAALLMPAPPAQAVQAPPTPATQPVTPADTGDAFLAALAPATDLPADTAAALTEAADRVCEGFTAGVPVAVMTTTLMGELSLTGEEARTLVGVATSTRCAA
jgi:hypothetical protein